ncbi:MAG: hypothetical protein Q4C85_08545 [Actinomyces sp.]|uniref:hypothetical protein n=1 Tax=Actinomyces sp. TaxID=29317 RepID=UPI0026DB2E88|nr:hypothetical protein [Actinomyces sp.]MDO4243786.1 hypothetical protein [Actinomyces sp.]
MSKAINNPVNNPTNSARGACEGCSCTGCPRTAGGGPGEPVWTNRTQRASAAVGKALGVVTLALLGALVVSLGVAALVGLWRVIL